MILLNAKDLSRNFGDVNLFKNVSFSIDSLDKIGLVGINGAGKSTLFKILTGVESYDDGELFKSKELKIGYLDQYACNDSDKSVYEETLDVFEEIIKIEKQLEEIQGDIEIENGDVTRLVNRQNELSEKYKDMGGFYYKNRVKSTLIGLGFSEEELEMKVSSLSGGQKTRVSLTKILLSDSNLLLLDEPTNHLDIEAVEWLEEYLKNFKGAVLIISHDRYFLDRVTNRTFEIENGKLYSQNGNYSFYIKQREIEKLTEERKYQNTTKEIERLEGIVEQQRRWNREKNIKTAESKLKVIEKLKEDLVKPEETLSETTFSFKAVAGGGDITLDVVGVSKRFDNKSVLNDCDMLIKRGEKVFLLGPNGCGKTTLLKLVMGIIEADKGSIAIGANTYLGYYDQIQENLDMNKTVIDELWDEYPQLTQTQIRNALAVFLFRGEDVFKEISKLSGGERARIELAKLILKKVNFLVMDEPTNHMDIQSKEALEKALSQYDGTMLIVSHDRYFINKLADKIFYMDNDGIKCYDGNYDYFLEKHKTVNDTTIEKKKQSVGAIDYKEQKRLESEKRKRHTKIKRCEEEIAKTEELIENVSLELQNPEIASDYEKAFELSNKVNELNEKLEELYNEWEELNSLDI